MKKDSTLYFCRCGQVAGSRNVTTGERLCLKCALEDMGAMASQGEHVAVSIEGKELSSVILVPEHNGKAHVLAPLMEVWPVCLHKN